LPAELLKSLDAVSMGAMDDELQPESTTRPTGGHNHPVNEKNVGGLPGVAKEVTDEGGPPTIFVDPDTGNIILKGTEEQLDEIEDIIYEVSSGDQPVVFRKFPLKYADVTTAGQLLETIFNQGQP
jgi:type II secretory pathway component GspD/PulD (secretin)